MNLDKNFFKENIKTVIYALLIAIFIRSIFFQPFYIPSSSMEPNLLVGDRLLVSKYTYGYSRHSFPFSPNLFNGRIMFKNPERGDVVVFKTPTDNRTDYPGKEIAQFIQNKWDSNFSNKIEIVFGNIWTAGNLSYHLKSKPEWTGGLWHGIKKIPENTNGGIVMIGDYNVDISTHKYCTPSNTSPHIVTLKLKSFNHSVCMIGKK